MGIDLVCIVNGSYLTGLLDRYNLDLGAESCLSNPHPSLRYLSISVRIFIFTMLLTTLLYIGFGICGYLVRGVLQEVLLFFFGTCKM